MELDGNNLALIAEWFSSGAPTLAPIASFGIVLVSYIVYRFHRRREKIAAIDSNLDLLQRLNEQALSSDENLVAAVKSVREDDPISIDDKESLAKARIAFFTYLRINRMLRAYEYRRHGIIGQTECDRIVKNYAGTLKEVYWDLDRYLPRGYPDKFKQYLKDCIEESARPPRLVSGSEN